MTEENKPATSGSIIYGPEKERHRLIRILVEAPSEKEAMVKAGVALEMMRLQGAVSHYHDFGSSVVCSYKDVADPGTISTYRFMDTMGKLLAEQSFAATRDAHVNTWKALLGSKTHYGPEPEEYEENIGEMLEQCWGEFEILGNPASSVNVLYGPTGVPIFTENHFEQVTKDPANTWVVSALVAGFLDLTAPAPIRKDTVAQDP